MPIRKAPHAVQVKGRNVHGRHVAQFLATARTRSAGVVTRHSFAIRDNRSELRRGLTSPRCGQRRAQFSRAKCRVLHGWRLPIRAVFESTLPCNREAVRRSTRARFARKVMVDSCGRRATRRAIKVEILWNQLDTTYVSLACATRRTSTRNRDPRTDVVSSIRRDNPPSRCRSWELDPTTAARRRNRGLGRLERLLVELHDMHGFRKLRTPSRNEKNPAYDCRVLTLALGSAQHGLLACSTRFSAPLPISAEQLAICGQRFRPRLCARAGRHTVTSRSGGDKVTRSLTWP